MWYGELHSSKSLSPTLKIKPMGIGFVRLDKGIPSPKDVAAARKALKVCEEKIYSDNYFMVILDEINNAVDYGLLDVHDVLTMLKNRPKAVNVVLTGRGAAPQIIAIADLVTEMKEVKHPFLTGGQSRCGIEF